MVEDEVYVMLMMMRADDSYTPATAGCSAEELLACITADDYDACIAACSDAEEEEEEEEQEVKAWTLNVTMKSAEGGEITNGGSSVSVVTYTLKATDEDININALVLEQKWYSVNAMDAALFINWARVSKVKPLKLDDKVTYNLSNSYTVKAGKSVDVEVRVSTIWNTVTEQFSVNLNSVDSSAETTKLPSNTRSNTFKLVGIKTAQITFDNWTISTADPKAGEKWVDLFSFKMFWDADQDVELSSIVLYTTDKSVADYLDNIVLNVNDEEVAEWKMNWRYLTFELSKPYKIEKTKNVTFVVNADVVWGAWETVSFTLEDEIDVVATALTQNSPADVLWEKTPLTSFKIKAGKITVTRENPGTTTFTKNRKNVYLGSFTITNNNKWTLNLDRFDIGFDDAVDEAWVYDDEIAATTSYVSELKVRYGSKSAAFNDLTWDNTTKTYYASDDQVIDGKLVVYVYADINTTAITTDKFQAKVTSLAITDEDNNKVDDEDISYTAAWATMKCVTSTANITNVTLAPKTYGKWATNVEASQFKIKAGTTEWVKVTSLTFNAGTRAVAAKTDFADAAAATAAANAINAWTDYTAVAATTTVTITQVVPSATAAANGTNKITVDGNDYIITTQWVAVNTNTVLSAKLDVDGTEYDAKVNNGTITVNKSFTVEAWKTALVTLKLNLSSNSTVVSPFTVVLNGMEAVDTSEDENNLDDNTVYEWRTITIWAGTLSVTMENVDNNKYAKSILAGTDVVVAEYNVKANNADVELIEWTVEFTVAGDTNLDARLLWAELYYGDTLIADDVEVTTNSILFSHVNATFWTTKTPLKLKLLTKAFSSNSDRAEKWLTITDVEFTEVYDEAWNNATPASAYHATIVREFDIVPATLVATATWNTAKTTVEFALDKWDNTRDDNEEISYKLDSLILDIIQNGLTDITIRNEANEKLYTTTKNTTACTSTEKNCWTDGTNYYRLTAWAGTLDWTVSDWTKLTVTYAGSSTDATYTIDLTDVNYKATANDTSAINNRANTALTLVTK